MFKMYIDETLFSTSESDELAIVNPTITSEVNKSASFTFTVPSSHPFANSIFVQKTLVRVEYTSSVDFGYEEVFYGRVKSLKKDFLGNLVVSCEDFTAFLNDVILRPISHTDAVAYEVVEELIDKYNAEVNTEKQIPEIYCAKEDLITKKWNYCTIKKAIDEIRKEVGGYVYPVYSSGERVLNICTDAMYGGKQVRLGVNILDIAQNIETADICTRLIPLGKKTGTQTVPGIDDRLTIAAVNDGKDYIDSEFAEDYGIIEKTVVFDTVGTASRLKTKAQNYLNSVQYEKLVLTISAVSLPYDEFAVNSANFNNIRVGEKVLVFAGDIETQLQFDVTKSKIVLDNPASNTLTLGSEVIVPLSEMTTELNNEAEQNKIN